MKKTIQYSYLSLFIACVFCLSSFAQNVDYAQAKEKIYIQTSHVFFKQGETVYFKIYIVNAADQTPATLSNTVYAEVINPAGNVLQKLNYRVEDGYAEGSYVFGEDAVGGIYQLRAYTTWMQNEKESVFFKKEITLQKVIAPRILMKLDFPEKGYGAGSEVNADFSMRNLSDDPIRFYEARFTVSLGGKAVHTGDFKTDQEGKAKIKFRLPAVLETNDGLLNITVSYDGYTEAISRSIPLVLNTIDLQFMPEGGSFIAGIQTNVAFKALNENGKAADVKGEVRDSKGNRVASFESYHFGMGRFVFTPQKGEKYTAGISSPANIRQEFELPGPEESGVVMNLSKSGKIIYVKMIASGPFRVQLTSKTRNRIFYTKNITLHQGENVVTINEDIFPAGITQFTLYSNNDLPLAERLMFLNAGKELRVTITADKKKYVPREKVTLTIETLDEKGKPVPSNFSLAVMDDKLWSFADDKQDHILSWLLMSSELQGKIEEPQFYFKKEEPKADTALDLVMLTQGYRYFDYIDFVRQEGRLKFTPDQDNIVSGVVLDKKGEPARAVVYLASTVTGGKGMWIETGEDGTFFFSHLEPGITYYVIAQPADKKKNISIKILQSGIGYNPQRISKAGQALAGKTDFLVTLPPANLKEVKEKIVLNNVSPANFMDVRTGISRLEEVVVTGYGAQGKRYLTGAVSIIKQSELTVSGDFATLLQGKAPGVQIIQNANPGASPVIRIRGTTTVAGGGQPLFIINGVMVEQPDLNLLNPSDVESITVLRDATSIALFGSKAANGVIVIEAKKFRNERVRFDFSKSYSYASQVVRLGGPAYTVARRFYAPKYTIIETEERTDYRETIYWNPVVQTDKQGKAVVEFYNSDASTTFRAIAEGIGWNGAPGRAETTYAAQNAMSVDAKIPPYLTVGDKALIPLVIKNNSSSELNIIIEVEAPAQCRIGEYINTIYLHADSARQVLIPLEAVAELEGTIRFVVKSGLGKETVVLPVSAADKGFPVVQTFSGNKSGDHHFMIGKMIPGSLKANLKLFKTLEGQLLDGIESMLREPYGCFEQTSSTTYPNIYVLKYLRESGKSNPEIEKKALGYIEKGYTRLLGFETAKHGFEWFGNTPPHEALTAYGLLEFTDMKSFIKVDEKMLARTKDFLMSRRDGKGGFHLSTGGYDRFASVPSKIANIYIVYALTQAGIGKEVQPEYEAAVKQALQSKDGYQLAMMALAANNMKNEQDYRQLMSTLNNLFQQSGLVAATSVVNSRDASLRVETASLYALALMRERLPDLGAVNNLITRILSEKSYYGYGSTQSTVLALQAIVEYSKLTGRMDENAAIDFVLNNKMIKEDRQVADNLAEGENSFEVRYPASDQKIPYSLEVAYYTLTPSASDKAELQLKINLAGNKVNIGETARLEVAVSNQKSELQPMAIAKIGIPAGLSVQPWQLKEIMEKKEIAYYELFDNYLVFYWMGFAPNETKKINLDLKAEIPGRYKGKASTTYLYYTPEYKHWNEGVEVEIQ